jgi:hypothetical protein
MAVLAAMILGAGCRTNESALLGTDRPAMRWCPEPVELALGRVWIAERRGGATRWVTESAVLTTEQPFNEVLVTWQLDVPEGAGARVDLRVGRVEAGLWSPWLYLGRAGQPIDTGPRPQSWNGGRVDVDYFVSEKLFDRLQVRISVSSEHPPVDDDRGLGRVFVQTLDTRQSDARATRRDEHAGSSDLPRLGVPFRSQRTSTPSLAGRLCSPASVAMVLAYHGVECSVEQVAALAYDPDFDLYGHWPNNLQAAHRLGVGGVLRRFACWSDVEHTLRRGRPIIASIRVGRGELPEAPYSATDGHLIVIEGMTPAGDLLVLDPAVEHEDQGRRVYSRRNMSRVWLGHTHGTAYVLDPDMRRVPVPPAP